MSYRSCLLPPPPLPFPHPGVIEDEAWAGCMLTTNEPDEIALIRRARTDPRAFGELYEAHVDAVYRLAWGRVRHHAEAEDITAQTFLRALENLGQYQPRGKPFRAWLFRIAGNLIHDRGRRVERDQRNARPEALPGRPDLTDPEAWLADADLVAQVGVALTTLPLEQQRVVILRVSQGRSTRETARVLGRSEAATKQLLHRAITALRRAVGRIDR